MPAEADLVYRDKSQILNSMIDNLLSRIPDARIDIDSVVRIWFEVLANEFEGQYIANQLLHNDIWPQTADAVALMRFGEEFAYQIEGGTRAEGSIRIEGVGGTSIPAGQQFAAQVLPGEFLVFLTTESASIPNPGVPSAPLPTDEAVAGNLDGTIEWALTFVTLEGETALGGASSPLSLSSSKASIDIPLGGPGTTARNLYRMENGVSWQFVLTVPDNSTTTVEDNVATGSLGGPPPTVSSAERVTVPAQAQDVGLKYNVAPHTIIELANVSDGVTGSTNVAPFQGGTEPMTIEEYRRRLLVFIQDPQSGSPGDLKRWAEEVDGVEEATVFVNMDVTTPKQGHNTIRISGPDGIIPDSDVVDAVVAKYIEEDLANITNHVLTFDPNVVDVDLDVAFEDGFSLDDVTPEVQEAVANYINEIPVSETVYVAGIVDAVFGLPRIIDVVVNTPTDNVESTDIEKAVAGTITVGAL